MMMFDIYDVIDYDIHLKVNQHYSHEDFRQLMEYHDDYFVIDI
jgi:hypothetical protein